MRVYAINSAVLLLLRPPPHGPRAPALALIESRPRDQERSTDNRPIDEGARRLERDAGHARLVRLIGDARQRGYFRLFGLDRGVGRLRPVRRRRPAVNRVGQHDQRVASIRRYTTWVRYNVRLVC